MIFEDFRGVRKERYCKF